MERNGAYTTNSASVKCAGIKMSPAQKARKAIVRRCWVLANKERVSATYNAWYKANKESVAKRNRAWYEANKDYYAGYRKDNKERVALAQHKYYEANKERKNAERRARYQTTKEHERVLTRIWQAANREHRAAYRKANRERIKAANRIWDMANKERKRAHRENHRARKRNADGCFSKQDVNNMWEMQRERCAAPQCNKLLSFSCTVDHVIPLSRGGSNWPRNLQLLCHSCNCSKGGKTMEEWSGPIRQVPRGANIRD